MDGVGKDAGSNGSIDGSGGNGDFAGVVAAADVPWVVDSAAVPCAGAIATDLVGVVIIAGLVADAEDGVNRSITVLAADEATDAI